jgi:multidrug efflux pump
MRFTDLFIKRPVLAIVVSLVIVIAGLQSIRTLTVRQYPRSDIAIVRVSTIYVGANADLVRGFITTPLERVIASADGIDYVESSSAQGLSTITVHLTLNYDTNAALTQIQAKVAQVRNDLPPEAERRSSSWRRPTTSSRPCTSGSRPGTSIRTRSRTT